MNTGRRGFIKTLGGVLAGLTVAGRLKAQEAKFASDYPNKFKKTSLPYKGPFNVSGSYASGIILTGVCPPISVSGYVFPHKYNDEQ